MFKFQKIVWHEGMKLDPHHFQQLDRYFQYSLNMRIGSINVNNWGLKELEIDTSALANGNFRLVKCSGVIPDGLFFNMPENDLLPKSRQITDFFEAVNDKLEVFLAIAHEHITGNNCQLEESSGNVISRYSLQTIDLLDDNIGANLRKVGVARPNFYIKFGEENFEEFSVIKIGEILRSADGTFVMSKNFIPPVLCLSASELIIQNLRELLGGLVSKSKELRNQLNMNKKEISFTDVEIFLLLHTINAYIPLINQYYKTPHYHPEKIYSLFLSLGGQLTTLFPDSGISATDLQPYNHNNFNEVFQRLFNQLKVLLNIQKKISRADSSIALNKQSDSLYETKLSEAQINSQLFLVVKSSMPESKIISEFLNNIKIAAHEEIFAVYQAGMKGVSIEYISRPPSGLSVDPENHYFKILKEGRLWDMIVDKQTIAFFLTKDFTRVELQLISFNPN